MLLLSKAWQSEKHWTCGHEQTVKPFLIEIFLRGFSVLSENSTGWYHCQQNSSSNCIANNDWCRLSHVFKCFSLVEHTLFALSNSVFVWMEKHFLFKHKFQFTREHWQVKTCEKEFAGSIFVFLCLSKQMFWFALLLD